LIKEFHIYDSDAMKTFGKIIGEMAIAGQIFAMDGELGAGKTTLTQGIARGLGIKERLNSPTFTFIQDYKSGKLPLMHMDAYRIETPELLDDIGYDDYLFTEYIIVIEWAKQIEKRIPGEAFKVNINYLEEGRKISIEYDQNQKLWMMAFIKKVEEVKNICIL